MNVRRLLIIGSLAVGAVLGLAPSAHAKPAACAWVDPYGACVSNPLPNLPHVPNLPLP